MTTSTQTRKVAFSRLWWVTGIAAVAAAAANALVYVIGSALGAFPADIIIPAAGQPISIMPVVFSSIMGAVGAAVVFALISRFSANPIRSFRIIAAVVLLASLATPFSIPNGTPLFYAMLLIMHITAGVIITVVLTTMVQES